MAGRKAAKKAARKGAPRPAKPPKKAAAKKAAKPAAKKAAKRAAPRRAPAKRAAKAKASAAPSPPPADPDDAWVFVEPEETDAADGWTSVEPDDADPWVQPAKETWEHVDEERPQPASTAPAARSPPAFDPATGAWLSVEGPAPAIVPAAPAVAPESRRSGTGPTLWTVLLGFDLAFLAFNAIASLVAGLVLVFAPDSELAGTLREAVSVDSPVALLAETLLTFAMFGVIPFLWVWGTRAEPREGTERYLHLHSFGRAVGRGALLAIPLLVAVVVLSGLYTVATQGVDGLTDPDESVNPAVEGILDNLTWPLAVVIALCAGLGEEIFFRGLLQRWVGVWGQAILFALAHAAGGYPPQVLFALGLGLLFGHLVKRGWSLWTLVTAHALYDLTLLATGLLSR